MSGSNTDAYAEGKDAYISGLCETDNPYDSDSIESANWNDGFNEAAEKDE